MILGLDLKEIMGRRVATMLVEPQEWVDKILFSGVTTFTPSSYWLFTPDLCVPNSSSDWSSITSREPSWEVPLLTLDQIPSARPSSQHVSRSESRYLHGLHFYPLPPHKSETLPSPLIHLICLYTLCNVVGEMPRM